MSTSMLMETSDRLCVLVQVGNAGVWGQFEAEGNLQVAVNDWVVCQTGRGIELGQAKLVGPLEKGDTIVGPLLRRAEDSDMLTSYRIQRALPQGIEACNKWLEEQGFPQQILEVDVPLDGQRLYFQFLGEVDASLERAIESLVNLMDEVTGIRQFTQAVAVGCGPKCGSDGSGCSTGRSPGGDTTSENNDGAAPRSGCTSCHLSGGCGNRRPESAAGVQRAQKPAS